jgi:Alginate export
VTRIGPVVGGMLAAAIIAAPATASTERPGYATFRYDEDWRPLCSPSEERSTSLDAIKCIRITETTTLTLGGDLRVRTELVDNPGFGLRFDEDQAVLARATVHGDLRIGSSLRAFVQFGFYDQGGRTGGPLPTDVDRGDLMQGFIDVSAPVADGRITLRVGRQEIGLGSSRIVSVRDGPNIRRAFDGVRSFWSRGSYRIDAFYVRPITIDPGAFDDNATRGERLAGVYATGLVPGIAALHIDLYALDSNRDRARFGALTAGERRRTVGVRLSGKSRGFDWDIETAYQWGRFDTRPIAAWTIASNVGHTFAAVPLSPRIGLKADIASGDRGGQRLGTFDALYPKFPYFSEANLFAPANIIDLHPEIGLTVTPRFKPYAGVDFVWRETVRDAVYTTPLVAIARTTGVGNRFTGTQAIAGFDWQASNRLVIAAQFVHFAPGRTVRDAGGRAVDFLVVSAAYRF